MSLPRNVPPHSSPLSALHHYFGFQEFRPLQHEAINAALSGKDVLMVMPTGAGKSLCFQLPATLSDGVTLVISPLVALMRDQVANLQARPEFQKIGVAAINSLQDVSEQNAILNELRMGGIRLLYVAPERFRSTAFRAALRDIPLARFVVDEAHCISEWGHDFRPDYLRLKEFIDYLGRPPIIAVTATATSQVRSSIINNLGMQHPQIFVGGFNRPNLHYSVQRCKSDAHRQEMLVRALPKLCAKGGSGLIYAATRKQCAELAELATRVLAPYGARAAAYHAGLNAETRLKLQHSWQNGEIAVLAATNAFGMGIDKPDVRFVVHYVHPESLESYYQEAGRAGRDGRPSRCVILYHFADRRLREWFIDNDSLTMENLQAALQLMNYFLQNSNDNTIIFEENEWKLRLGWTSLKMRLAIGALERAEIVDQVSEISGQWNLRVLQKKILPSILHKIENSLNRQREERLRRLREMVDYCKTTSCRRHQILAYFGDEEIPTTESTFKSTFCCDNCARPPQETAPSNNRLARIPMPQSIDRTDIYSVLEGLDGLWPTVGKNRLNLILRGSKSKEVEKFRQNGCPLLGVFDSSSRDAVNEFLMALIDEKLLHQGDEDEYFVCSVTEKGRAIWQNKEVVKVLLPRGAPVSNTRASKTDKKVVEEGLDDEGKVLFESLRKWRWRQARQENVAAFVIFSNRCLLEVAHYKPQNERELLQVHGMGEKKIQRYGEDVLQIVRGEKHID